MTPCPHLAQSGHLQQGRVVGYSPIARSRIVSPGPFRSQLYPNVDAVVSSTIGILWASIAAVPMRNSIFSANDEPTVEELLADPIASLLMARDGVQSRE